MLLHLIDVSGEVESDPVDRFKIITSELKKYSRDLAKRPQIVVATKSDAAEPERLQSLKRFAKGKKLPFVAISAVTAMAFPIF